MHVDRTTFTNFPGAKHAYEVDCQLIAGHVERKTFEVHANNRDQAARIVARDGWYARSVNMMA